MKRESTIGPDGRPEISIPDGHCFEIEESKGVTVTGELRPTTDRERAEQVILRAAAGADVPPRRIARALVVLLRLGETPEGTLYGAAE